MSARNACVSYSTSARSWRSAANVISKSNGGGSAESVSLRVRYPTKTRGSLSANMFMVGDAVEGGNI